VLRRAASRAGAPELIALLAAAATLLAAGPAVAQQDGDATRLLRQPTVSDAHVAFAYGNDLWIVGREGGAARRLTSHPGTESHPHFSPDGRWVAFSAEYAGDEDVYVVPAGGGEPRRLTWHPGGDQVRGWTPDGERVVFVSGRTGAPVPYDRFYTVSPEGGLPEALPIPRGHAGSFSPDGSRFAYQPVELVDEEWRNYRGGQIRPIWVVDTDDWELEKLPFGEAADVDPVWLGETVYFLSDRDLAMNVWAYDTGAGELRQVTRHRDFDVKALDAGGGAVVYEQGGWIHLLDPASGQSRRLEITAEGDFPWARTHWEDVGELIRTAGLGPSGARAVFEARGDVFTVPAEKGDSRNLTRSPGAADRTPAWSPDGERVAWFTDASGEYRLVIGDPRGLEEPREIEIEDPTFFYDLAWSPDGERLLFTDADRHLWMVEAATGEKTLVDQDNYTPPGRTMDPAWAPDARWIAYAKRMENGLHSVFVYSVEEDVVRRVTDPMADALYPAWDAGGKYLWLAASTDYALNTGWLDMSSYDRPVSRGLYLAVLDADEPSPLLPESDEEAAGDEEDGDGGADGDAGGPGEAGREAGGQGAGDGQEADGADDDAPTVEIDFEGLQQRLVALDVPEENYADLEAAGEGVLFYRKLEPTGGGFAPAPLLRYDLEEREASEFLPAVQDFTVSHDGSRLLYRMGDDWSLVPTQGKVEPGQGKLATGELRARVDPGAEWRQIFEEAWRFQRDYLYVDNVHGADWDRIHEMYAPWVEHVRHRSDLTYLLDVLGGEVSVGHSFTFGGDEPDVEEVPVGLLGADLEAADGRYRIATIYTGESWTPDIDAPLSAPGVDVSEGDYLLAVDGREVTASDNPYRFLDGTAGRQTVLTVNDRPTTEGARTVAVVPVESEFGLRGMAWVEANRRKVDSLSNGRLAYVYLPNTAGAGYEMFNRYFFAQQDKEGVVLDERFNGGGSAADYMIDVLSRDLRGFFNNPAKPEKPFTLPGAGIWGPKVMIINENAGSGGDLLPYMFRQADLGPLVGRSTWGGLVGIWDVPSFIDGGAMTAPRGGFYDLDGEWAVENEGVPPDIRVEQTPREVIAGGDPQLERAVREALRLLEARDWPELLPQPAPPVRAERPGSEGGR
jgi:tricorn protease